MKKIYFFLLCAFFSQSKLSAQSDFAIEYVNYAGGSQTAKDTVVLDFTVQNISGESLVTGDTLYFSARINGNYFGLNLTGKQTAMVLKEDLPVGASVTFPAGYLIGSQALLFFPGQSTVEMCAIVWGKGKASVDYTTPSFPGDTDPANNVACVTYNPAYVTGLRKNSFEQNIQVYPNPARDIVYIKATESGNYQILLHDISGKIVRQIHSQSAIIPVSVSGLSTGMYFYTISDGTAFSSGKIFVQ